MTNRGSAVPVTTGRPTSLKLSQKSFKKRALRNEHAIETSPSRRGRRVKNSGSGKQRNASRPGNRQLLQQDRHRRSLPAAGTSLAGLALRPALPLLRPGSQWLPLRRPRLQTSAIQINQTCLETADSQLLPLPVATVERHSGSGHMRSGIPGSPAGVHGGGKMILGALADRGRTPLALGRTLSKVPGAPVTLSNRHADQIRRPRRRL